MRKPLLIALALLGVGVPSAGDGSRPIGQWQGRFEMEGQDIRVEVEISEGEGGALRGSVDFRDVPAVGIPLGIQVDGRSVVMRVGGVRPLIEGELDESLTKMTARLWVSTIGDWREVVLVKDNPDFRRFAHPRLTDAGAVERRFAYRPPEPQEGGWEVSTLAAEGVEEQPIAALVEEILRGEHGRPEAILLARNGRLVLEEYFYGFERERLHPIQSATKSITSLLFGIAKDRGSIGGLDRPVHEFFLDYEGEPWIDQRYPITLFHLLTMSAAIEWSSPEANSLNAMLLSGDWIGHMLGLKRTGEPDREAHYNSGLTTVLGDVVRRSVGKSLAEFADETLFADLGVSRYRWRASRKGVQHAAAGLVMTAYDFAKMGQLVLDEGIWNGRQIVSRSWIEESVRKHLPLGADSVRATGSPHATGYAYQWWILSYEVGGRTIEGIGAMGYGGQYLGIFPELDAVVVLSNGEWASFQERVFDVHAVVEQWILPALTELGGATSALKPAEGPSKVADLDIWGSISPSGRLLAFIDWSTGNLALRDQESGETRPLTAKGTWADSSEFGMFPVFSPEEDRIAYTWFNDRGYWELRSLEIEGGEPSVLFSDPERLYVQPYAWSPDGATILVGVSENSEANRLALAPAVEGEQWQNLALLDWRVPSTACFGSGGSAVVFDQLPPEGTNRSLQLLPIDGGEQLDLGGGSVDHLLLGCSPDGERIAFASDRTGSWQVWNARIEGSALKPEPAPRIENAGPLVRGLGITHDGVLYFGRTGGETSLFLLTLDGESLELLSVNRVAGGIVPNSEATWSPDGSRLAYIAQRGTIRSGLIYSYVLQTDHVETGRVESAPLKMRTFGGHTFALDWSADGSFILAQGRDHAGREGYYRIDPEGAQVEVAIECDHCPPACLEWPSLATDGTLYFTRWVSGGQRLVARDLATGAERSLLAVETPHAIGPLRVSPDGERLAVLWRDERQQTMRLKILSIAAGEVEDLVDLTPAGRMSGLGWLPNSETLLYTTTDHEGTSILWGVAADGGDPRRLGALEGHMRVYGLDVHPDGRRVAVTGGPPGWPEVWLDE